MLDRLFRLSENHTSVRTELLAGLTTFLTMAYIIVVQPAVLSGVMFGTPTGMDFGAITTATCLSAALASAIMGFYGRYPIAQAPGMGENFFFVVTLLPAAAGMIASQVAAGQLAADSTSPWQIGLGVIFWSGMIFLILSMLGVREKLMEAISPSMRNGIAIGIGLFVALIGLENTKLVSTKNGLSLNPQFLSPDIIVFFFGLFVTAGLHCAVRAGLDHLGDFGVDRVCPGAQAGFAVAGRRGDGLAGGEGFHARRPVYGCPCRGRQPAVDRADIAQDGSGGR